MLEGAVMEYVKWFIGMVSLFMISVAVILMFNLNEVNSFQQEVNYQIERNGGLTPEALQALDQHARNAYGGCLAATDEFKAPCLFPQAGDTGSSGFYVKEYIVTGADASGNDILQWYERPSTQQARYGVPVRYVIVRNIGDMEVMSLFKPQVIGSSASRVRGNSDF